MTAYYNEWDLEAAAVLQSLINHKQIPDGVVDTRSITEVQPDDLRGFNQCHFFAGFGGWPLALKLAGVPDTATVWTGSPPCQPFSNAGNKLGFADPRHLAPALLDLVAERRPPVLFGEQVEAAIGKLWLDFIFADLEAEGYTCGSAVLPACSVGAPHRRYRIMFGAELDHCVGIGRHTGRDRHHGEYDWQQSGTAGADVQLGDLYDAGLQIGRGESGKRALSEVWEDAERSGGLSSLLSGISDAIDSAEQREIARAIVRQLQESHGVVRAGRRERGPDNSFWSGADWLGCRDGFVRPVEPGTFPLAHGVPARVVRLRGYGNAIVPQVAAAFIKAWYASQHDQLCFG